MQSNAIIAAIWWCYSKQRG